MKSFEIGSRGLEKERREFMREYYKRHDETLKRYFECYCKFNKWRQNLIKKELKEGMNK